VLLPDETAGRVPVRVVWVQGARPRPAYGLKAACLLQPARVLPLAYDLVLGVEHQVSLGELARSVLGRACPDLILGADLLGHG